ncbi:hypothetical protein ACS0TY_026306 [Phlomoides rotata]
MAVVCLNVFTILSQVLHAQATTLESTLKYEDSNNDFDETAFYGQEMVLLLEFPLLSSWKSNDWERISTSEKEQMESTSPGWWSEGI